VAGVMVVYHPPITHLPPPAVGASPDAAIHDFKGSCRRSSQCGGGRRGRSRRRGGRGWPWRTGTSSGRYSVSMYIVKTDHVHNILIES